MKILLIGDQHCMFHDAVRNLDKAVELEAELVIFLGDFGFTWDEKEISIFRRLEDAVAERGLTAYWLDGNHENFDLLEEVWGYTPDGASDLGLQPSPMSANISYLPRGTRFELDGVKFMAFGGAVSVDRKWRTEGLSWWAQELITEDQVARITDEPVDILLSHDVHTLAPTLAMQLMTNNWKVDETSTRSRQLLSQVVDKVKPQYVFHGHYHFSYRDRIDGINIQGLDMGYTNSSIALIDTEDFKRAKE